MTQPASVQTPTETAIQLSDALAGFICRPLRREDLPALHAMLLVADEVDGREGVQALKDMQAEFDYPWSNPEADSLVVLTPEGQPLACVRTFLVVQGSNEAFHVYLEGTVAPAYRGRGLGSFVFGWARARGEVRLRACDPGVRRCLRASCMDFMVDRMALYEANAFRPIRTYHRMRRSLSEPIPKPDLPAGLSIRPYSKAFDEGMRATRNEAFLDHWDSHMASAEDWQQFYVGRSSFRPDLTGVVFEGDEVVGMGLCSVDPQRNARQGFSEGWLSSLGVRRRWRKRGVARALICAAMECFRAAGLEYAALGVDTQNATGALALYERLGFVTVRRSLDYEKVLGEA